MKRIFIHVLFSLLAFTGLARASTTIDIIENTPTRIDIKVAWIGQPGLYGGDPALAVFDPGRNSSLLIQNPGAPHPVQMILDVNSIFFPLISTLQDDVFLFYLDRETFVITGEYLYPESVGQVSYEMGGTSFEYTAVRAPVDPTVPEPSTYLAGALLLLPIGFSVIRSVRRKQAS